MNYTRPQLAIQLDQIKQAFLDAKKRGIRLRYLTEITTENVSYCKELMSIVDELRHLDGIKGSFMVNESEYLAPIVLFEEGKIASEIICSNLKELVEQQQYLFDSFWSRAIPADQKIVQIEKGKISNYNEGKDRETTKVLENQDEIYNKIKDLIENTDELLVCSEFDGGMQMVYDNFFDSYKTVLEKYNKGKHKGIRWIGAMGNNKNKKDNIISDLIERFLDLGVQVRHIRTILPINFAIGGKKELHASIEYIEDEESGNNTVQSLLVSNEPAYIKHFTFIFEELWKNSLIL